MVKKLTLLLVCLFATVSFALAQSIVKGHVTSSEDDEPVIGATVQIPGTKLVTVTNMNGDFEFKSVPAYAKNVKISCITMKTQVVPVKNFLKIILEPDAKLLSEVVVVAYGKQKRQSLTGSVASIDSKKLENTISTSATSALEGAAPGIQVNNTYGEPGKDPLIRIRGFASVNGSNAPLYVVDGVPYDGNISDLNSSDIESISVLKDASSAALYGNRASNGVILITTKKAKGLDKVNFQVKMNQGLFTRGIRDYDRLGTDTWMETMYDSYYNSLATQYPTADAATIAKFTRENIVTNIIKKNIYDKADNALFDENGKLVGNKLSGYNDLDWYDILERSGRRQEYNVSGSYATEKLNVYSSLGYMKEDGYIISTNFERYTGRFKTTYDPAEWLKVGMNLSGSMQKQSFNDAAEESYAKNPFYTARYMAPIYPYYLHNADGSLLLDENGNAQYDLTSDYLNSRHIAYELENDKQTRSRNTLSIQSFATLNLPYNFKFTIKGSLDRSTSNIGEFENPNIGDGAGTNGRYTVKAYQYQTYNAQELLTWEHQFDRHNVDVLAGHENYSYSRKYSAGLNTNMNAAGIYVPGNFITNSYLTGFDDSYKTESYLARVRYNYAQKYFADASFRADGSSRFHKDNRWGNFFSVGGNWLINKEEFMRDLTWVNDLKLRASYGEVGNDAGADFYAYMGLFELDKNGGNPSLLYKSLFNKEIKWETTQTIDLALEGRLFDRINFSIGYFDKRSKDLLFDVKLQYSAGYYPFDDEATNMSVTKNIGTVSNKGLELAIDGDILKQKDWRWNVGLDATLIKNELVSLPGGKDIPAGLRRYSEGHSIYEFYTYHFVGVDQLTGQSLYTIDPDKKTDAQSGGALTTIDDVDYTTEISYAQKGWRGSALPDVYGSVHTNLSWKDLSLNVLMTYSLGGKVFDGTYQDLMSTTDTGAAALHSDLLGSWTSTPQGMKADSPNRIWADGIPQINGTNSAHNNASSDRWLTSASYMVMKNISLTYDIPTYLITPLGMSAIKVSAGVENLFTLTARKGLNPQYSYSGSQDNTYTTARVWNLGLTLNF